jgi:uncharacterized repeat protein (TIGR01451 family)
MMSSGCPSLRSSRRAQRLSVGLMTVLVALLLGASAAGAAPVWRIASAANTNAAPGGTVTYAVTILNMGTDPTDGSLLEVTATLPDGLTVDSAAGSGLFGSEWDCSSLVVGDPSVTCSYGGLVEARNFAQERLLVTAAVDPAATGVKTAGFVVTGGGAAESASTVDPTVISPVVPGFGIDAFDGRVVADAADTPFTQAGGHPFAISTYIDINRITDDVRGTIWPAGSIKDIHVELPPGVVGDPTAMEQCTVEQLAQPNPACPTGSQAGVVSIIFDGGLQALPGPFYNMVPPVGAPARFGINVAGEIISLDATVRTGGDYGLTISSRNSPQAIGIVGLAVTFWGFPADPVHNIERRCPSEGIDGCSTEAPVVPLLRNPTSCTPAGVGLETRLRANSWEAPDEVVEASFVSHLLPAYPFAPIDWGAPQGPTGCDLVPFDPSIAVTPATPAAANEPSGIEFDLSVPQIDRPTALGQSDVRKVVVTLPEGVRVSPPSAHGLQGCSSTQIALSSASAPSCPDASKIGTMTVTTPLLEEPLTGHVFLATPFDNPSNTLLGIYIVARGQGVTVKLAGGVQPDPDTGQLTATFDDLPQLPFSNFHLEFTDGPRAPLVLPRTCGTHTTHAVLTGWSGKTATVESSFTLDHRSDGTPCPSGASFTPEFVADGLNPVAGAFTPFALTLSRDDQDEEFRTLTVRTPRGVLAKVAGVPKCGAAQAAAGTCGEASRIGTVTTGAGAGENPFFLSGGVYFAGPYKGAPFSLSIVVPAKAGPFDLGTVVVRAAIRVNKRTAALTTVADPLPTILQGIPLQVREVRVRIDRERFFLNRTNCNPTAVRARVGSTEGTIANLSTRYQVSDCSRLKLRPRMSLWVGGRGHTREGASTPLVTRIRRGPGQANLASVGVRLPLIFNARLAVIEDACTPAQFDAGDCEQARAGVATVRTPLLDEPLGGGVFFVEKPSGRGLPNMVIALRGEVDVDLVGTVKIPASNQLGTVFRSVPDVPFSSFTLRLFAGENGPLGTTANLCSRRARRATAAVRYRGQNGHFMNIRQRIKVAGCGRR